MKRSGVQVIVLLLVATLPALAHAAPSDDLFSTVAHSIGFTKFRRFFTFNPVGKAELTLAIDNGLLVKAEDQLAKGENEKAAITLAEFQTERETLHTQVGIILGGTLNHTETKLVRDTITDEAAELESLRKIKPEQVADIRTLQDESVDHIDTILEKSSLSNEERAIEITAITSKVSETVSKPEEKVAKKLALKNDLADIATRESVKSELASEEDRNVAEAASLSTPEIESLVTLLSDEKPKHNLVVLQKLLTKASEDAKPHL